MADGQLLHAEAPQAELFDYAIASACDDAGQRLLHDGSLQEYEEVPAMQLAQKIIDAHKAEEEA